MNPYFSNGHERIFGTYPLKGEALHDAVGHAIEAGYRTFDTAQMYGNEADLGAALAECGLPRGDLLVTTKVVMSNFAETDFLASVERSLADLRADQLDVLLLHWPPADGDVVPSLRLLERARREGMARHVGVSNYTIAMLETARDVIEAPIACNQVEFHPLLDQTRLTEGANRLGIPLTAYCSVARGEVFEDPDFAEIGRAYGRTAGQVVLRWILQTGVAVNTMSTNPANIAANFDVMDFTLSTVDMARIDAKRVRNRRLVDRSVVASAPDFD